MVDAILTADWHLREAAPVCRTDDFWETQWQKVDFVAALQREHRCPVFHAGDLFHHWKPSPYLLSEAIERLPSDFFTVYGNHDLPYHRFENRNRSGLAVLEKAGAVNVLVGAHYGEDPDVEEHAVEIGGRKILVWHKFVWRKELPFPGALESDDVLEVQKLCRGFDLILSGDNHIPFTVRFRSGRLFVNPGGITRQTANQHSPRVYLWDAGENAVKKEVIPHVPDAVTREHIEKENEKNEKLNAFIERLDHDWEVELNFLRNLENFAAKNKVERGVMDIVYKSLEEQK